MAGRGALPPQADCAASCGTAQHTHTHDFLFFFQRHKAAPQDPDKGGDTPPALSRLATLMTQTKSSLQTQKHKGAKPSPEMRLASKHRSKRCSRYAGVVQTPRAPAAPSAHAAKTKRRMADTRRLCSNSEQPNTHKRVARELQWPGIYTGLPTSWRIATPLPTQYTHLSVCFIDSDPTYLERSSSPSSAGNLQPAVLSPPVLALPHENSRCCTIWPIRHAKALPPSSMQRCGASRVCLAVHVSNH